ncbi:four helix bundle protein [Larkinella rosea]|uniref:Four helix bundle protein n=1 Tax=Larkinella rosea TaxID=2025312 RepID=A0A3P1BMP9_9BACT|nr:four helix bundle protein [Larkinella rosea]RRB02341.1 four helix bundle protein [Larkinella rosea]
MGSEQPKYVDVTDLEVYKVAFDRSNLVWKVVMEWSPFAKDTIEKQFVRALDSLSANIAEGYGRYGRNDKIRFYFILSGSLRESIDSVNKAKNRNLIDDQHYNSIYFRLSLLPKLIHQEIKYTRDHLKI